ncbi:ArsR/SmtB family transcription factor [Streptomyces lycii]|uniref:Helix-turn-helix transcriptional regulator n=1 Tax=Streptomyces lycii TaxID=2654337 RepID=A0ABQ7FII5_9ACTN|nr:helix-turn-helix domain-containing protein [Streptomyces lycii]KAF4408789.1 helix-turn-helix transcriptional regulator [Streptomyces lycii]
MAREQRMRVLDPEQDSAALKALTHPLRIQLLGMLRQDGAATATELAERAGESSASTSYHLRVLAKYGFVTEAEHRDGRERRWQAAHDVTAWSNEAMEASPASRAFVTAARQAQAEHLERSLTRHAEDMAAGRLGPEWLEPSGVSDQVVRLTPESLTELWDVLRRTTEELAARDEDDVRAEQVVLLHAALPLAGAGREGATGADGSGGTDKSARAAVGSGGARGRSEAGRSRGAGGRGDAGRSRGAGGEEA